jgi:hypothetical protein
MLRWFVFTITFGLLPFGFSVLLQALHLLFFSVMVCSAQMAEIFATLSGGKWLRRRKRTLLSWMFCLFLVGGVCSSMLYGVYVDHERSARWLSPGRCPAPDQPAAMRDVRSPPIRDACHEWLDFQTNLFRFSVWIAVGAAILGTVTEWIRTRRRR